MEIKKSIIQRLILALLFTALLLASSCSDPELVAVSGKTVYRDMSLEGVRVSAFRKEGDAFVFHSSVESKYHGDFLIRLPRGIYVFTAKTSIPTPDGTLSLTGKTGTYLINRSTDRIDMILIELLPESNESETKIEQKEK